MKTPQDDDSGKENDSILCYRSDKEETRDGKLIGCFW
jgi:hypothetical protein